MGAQLDHVILPVNDLAASRDFYTRILGFRDDGERPPFTTLRVSPTCVLQLAPFGTRGGTHLAFAMSHAELDAALARVQAAGIRYGDAFDAVGNMRGPGSSDGARGTTTSLYLFDPNEHLIELLCYD